MGSYFYLVSCINLQAVNLAGLVRITEETLLFLASRCEGLLMLNLTGCERVSVAGLDHLIKGLHFVEKAVSFMGFKPIDEHGKGKKMSSSGRYIAVIDCFD